MKKQMLCCCIGIIALLSTTAQNTSPFWSLAGNSNATSTSKLGTTNSINLGIFTNNLERMRVNTSGHVGIGTTTPAARLHVNSPAAVHSFISQVNGVTKLLVHSGGGVSIGSGSTPPGNGLFVSGNTGIGTSAPENKLHVFKGSAGTVTGNVNAPLIIENSTNAYANILAPTASETGILFGNPASATGGGIIYNNANTQKGFQFRTDNNTTKMVILQGGNVGINTLNPQQYRLKIVHSGFEGGLNIENDIAGNDWEFFMLNSDALSLYFNLEFRGSFDPTSGAYTPISDGRLKTNVSLLPEMLSKVIALKPSVYQFRHSTEGKPQYGFIAQEVQKIFPEVVNHIVTKERNTDVYTIDYNSFTAIAIKAIQELKTIVDEQQQRIALLESAAGAGRESLKGWIKQNSPNPVISSTRIEYFMPDGARSGRILLTNSKGAQLKVYNVQGHGFVNFTAGTLPSGSYTYSLVVDGKTVSSKKLIIAR